MVLQAHVLGYCSAKRFCFAIERRRLLSQPGAAFVTKRRFRATRPASAAKHRHVRSPRLHPRATTRSLHSRTPHAFMSNRGSLELRFVVAWCVGVCRAARFRASKTIHPGRLLHLHTTIRSAGNFTPQRRARRVRLLAAAGQAQWDLLLFSFSWRSSGWFRARSLVPATYGC